MNLLLGGLADGGHGLPADEGERLAFQQAVQEVPAEMRCSFQEQARIGRKVQREQLGAHALELSTSATACPGRFLCALVALGLIMAETVNQHVAFMYRCVAGTMENVTATTMQRFRALWFSSLHDLLLTIALPTDDTVRA